MWNDSIDMSPTNAILPNGIIIGAIIGVALVIAFIIRKKKLFTTK